MKSDDNFMICEFFNAKGRPVERIIVTDNEADPNAAARTRANLTVGAAVVYLNALKAKAEASGAVTEPTEGATAVQALLYQIIDERISLGKARRITSVSVNFRKAVKVGDLMGCLEAKYGGYAVNWAREVFEDVSPWTPGIN